MHARLVWVLALGIGMLVLMVPASGRAAAAPSPLCIGPTGNFVVCGGPGSAVVTPTTTAPTTTPPTTVSPSTTTPGTISPGTTTPSTATPGTTTPAASTTVPGAGATRPRSGSGPHRGGLVGAPGEYSDVIVGGSIAGFVLFVDLIGLVRMSPRRTRPAVPR